MKKSCCFFIKNNKRILCCISTLFFYGVLHSEEVVLNPGYISGEMKIGDIAVSNNSTVRASSTSGIATTRTSSGHYTLTVNTGDSGESSYSVSAYAYMDNNRDRLYFESKIGIVARSGEVSPTDFIIANPGFIQGSITVNGGAISSGNISAYAADASGFSRSETSFYNGGDFHFPVNAHGNIRLSGNVYLTNGDRYPLDNVYLSVSEDQIVNHNFEINVPDRITGTLSGVLDIIGQNVTQFSLYTRKITPPYTALPYTQYNNGPYSLEREIGDWTTQLSVYMNGYDDSLAVPYKYISQNSHITAGGNTINGTAVEPSFINGKIKLSGSVSENVIYAGSIQMQGVPGVNYYSNGGRAGDKISAGGVYDAIVTDGVWQTWYLSINIREEETAATQGQSITVYPSPSFSDALENNMTSGQIKNNVDIAFKTGSLTLQFRNLSDQLISYPRLTASCFKNNEAGVREYRYSPYVSGSQRNVALPTLKLIGLEGECNLTATGQVGGSSVTFGKFATTIHPGTDVVTDLGAPSLSVISPEPETFTTDAELSVSGTVTDENGVASIGVNGTDVPFVSTNNAQDANEVQFETSVTLASGENDIAITVVDALGNTLTETRNVYRDGADPTIDWTPADGTVIDTVAATEAVLVSGTATDDTGIETITVNGAAVTFASTNNPQDAQEVSFSVTLTLAAGTNPTTVIVTDKVGRQAGGTRIITLSGANQVPVANAGPDQQLECNAALTTANLDGSASSDADNDPLSYNWAGSFGLTSGVNTTVQLALGVHLIDLTVSDGTESATDQLSIVVEDTTAPVITLAGATLEATSLNGAPHDPVASVNDPCTLASYTVTPNLAIYPLGQTTVTVNAQDDSANTSTASAVVIVEDTTAPELTQPADITVTATGSLTTPDLGVASATDIFAVTVSNDLPATGLSVGSHEVVWTATDANGNVSRAVQTVSVQYDFCGGFMPPLMEGKVYKRRNTLPVKFQLCYADGSWAADANATLSVQQLTSGEPVGEPIEILSTSSADSGTNFRFSSDKYIYNLEVSTIAAGEYRLSANLHDGSALKTIDVGLK